MSIVSDEGQMQAAYIMRDAANKTDHAASTIEEAARRIAVLLEDGYGGNGLLLVKLLQKEKQNENTSTMVEQTCGGIVFYKSRRYA